MNISKIVTLIGLNGKSIGTGFFVSPYGHIITCKHVLKTANLLKTKGTVNFKYSDSSSIQTARVVEYSNEEDLVLLSTGLEINDFFCFCNRKMQSLDVLVYGFPNGSNVGIYSSAVVTNYSNGDRIMQLEKANAITCGFSGAPVIYDNLVVGIISGISEIDSHGRLTEVAFAIPSKKIISCFSKYITSKDMCIGYGDKAEKCTDYVAIKSEGLCRNCFSQQFLDSIKSIYKAQNYIIHQKEDYFIAELKYGMSVYYDAIFTIIKFDDRVSQEDLAKVVLKKSTCDYNVSKIIVITNAEIDKECSKYIEKNNIEIRSKEDLLHFLFNFDSYKNDLIKHVNSKQLSEHYIQVYSENKYVEKRLSIEEFEDVIYYEDDEVFEYYEDLEYEDEKDDDYEYDEEFKEHEYYENELKENLKNDILLKENVKSFIFGENKALLILGDYGSGKTSFCYNYALDLLDSFMKYKSGYFPLLIKLRGYNKAVGINQLLTDYFVNSLGINNFNIASFKLLLKNLNVVLIFDGYDEVAKKVDFDVKYDVLKEICNLADKKTKIILTCRPNYFQSHYEFDKIFKNSPFPFEPGDTPRIDFVETSIKGLTKKQVEEYIESFSDEFSKNNISVEDILSAISNTHDLTDLSQRPFLLYMIVNTLPQILLEVKTKDETKINAAKLYAFYTDMWIKREDNKNKTLIKQSDKELFCKEFALELYISDSDCLSYKDFPDTIKKYFKDVSRIEDIDYFSHDIQSCSFLTSDRSGDFKFIHKSFMEYFVADRIVCKINESNEDEQMISIINDTIGNTFLSMEICFFINDIISTNKKFLDKIKYFYSLVNDTARKNILSILSKTDTNLSEFITENYELTHPTKGLDLSFVKFRGKRIQNLNFSGCCFFQGEFDNVTFVNCDFTASRFEKARLNGVIFINCNFFASKWKETRITNSRFTSSIYELLQRNDHYLYNEYIEVCFDGSLWMDIEIAKCSFYSCTFIDSKMHSIRIHNTKFQEVDFSGTKIKGSLRFEDNKYVDVIGQPYELC